MKKTRTQSIKTYNLWLKRIFNQVFNLGPISNPIVILATRRGGSTYISNELCQKVGSIVLDHPFGRRNFIGENVNRLYGHTSWSQLFYLNTLEQHSAFKNIVNAHNVASMRWRGMKNILHANHTVLKVTEAKWLCSEFEMISNTPVLWYLRNPLDQIMSVMSFGWQPSLGKHDIPLLSKFYPTETLKLSCEIYDNSDLLGQHTVCWFLENEWLKDKKKILRISHEEILDNPQLIIRLKKIYNIHRNDSVLKRIDQRADFPLEARKRVFELLHYLGSDIYSRESSGPTLVTNIADFE